MDTDIVTDTEVIRTTTYRRCPSCGSVRVGYRARGWARDSILCPKCMAVVEFAKRYLPDEAAP